MPQDATCPTCQATFPVTESRQAFTVACPACDAEMTVEFKKPITPPEAGQPHYELLVKPGALVTAAPAPPKKKNDIDDDDEGNEPKRKGGSAAVVMLSGGCGMLIVLGGLGLTAWVLFGLIGTTPAVTYNRPNNQPGNRPGQPNQPNTQPNNPFVPFVPPQPPKPKDVFDLRPVTAALPAIAPPALLSDPASVDLGRVGMVAVGGGGRYLVMHLPDKGQLTVFDVNTAQFTATVPADATDAHLTAGVSKVVLAAPNSRAFRVYALPNLTKEYDFAPAPDGIRGMAMGSRTNGPMMTIGTFGRVQLWDVGGGGIAEVEGASADPGVHWHDRCLRAAPDGLTFTTHDGFRQGQNTILLTTQNRKWKVSADTYAVPFPGVDGNFYGNGVAVNKSYQDLRIGGVGAGSGNWFLPSVSSRDFFMKLTPVTTGNGGQQKKTLTVSIHKGRNSETVATGTTPLNDLPEFDDMVDRWRGELSVVPDQHLFLIPEAKLLVTLTKKRDKLVVRRVEPR